MVSLPSPKEQHTDSSIHGTEHEELDAGLPVALPHTAEIIKGDYVYVLFLLLSKIYTVNERTDLPKNVAISV